MAGERCTTAVSTRRSTATRESEIGTPGQDFWSVPNRTPAGISVGWKEGVKGRSWRRREGGRVKGKALGKRRDERKNERDGKKAKRKKGRGRKKGRRTGKKIRRISRRGRPVRLVSWFEANTLCPWFFFLDFDSPRSSLGSTVSAIPERLSFDPCRQPSFSILFSEGVACYRSWYGGSSSFRDLYLTAQ